ncbi:MAG: DUF3784 domain-containing protein [Rikenellaceae bacterium]|nr:DUF3784 domain-containing protein [Rikenellaceae bacterium]
MTDFVIHLFIGSLLIILGLLVKRFPTLIAGYNTMPEEERRNVDIVGLSSFMRRHLVILGALWILIAVGLVLSNQTDAAFLIYLFYVPIYAFWMVARAQRYNHNS